MATFAWNDNAVYEVHREGGDWIASGMLVKLPDSPVREHLLRTSIDALKRLGWDWIATVPADMPRRQP